MQAPSHQPDQIQSATINEGQSPRKSGWVARHAYLLIGFLLIVTLVFGLVVQHMVTTLPPGTTLGSIDIGGLTPTQAINKVTLENQPADTIILSADGFSVASAAAMSSYRAEVQTSLLSTIPEKPINRIMWYLDGLQHPHQISLIYSFSPEQITEQFNQLAAAVFQPFQEPTIELARSGQADSLQLQGGVIGRQLNPSALEQVFSQMKSGQTTIILSSSPSGSVLSEAEKAQVLDLASHLINKTILIKAERAEISLDDRALVGLLQLPSSLDTNKLLTLIDQWQSTVGNPPQNPELVLSEDGKKAVTFTPPRNGRTIQTQATQEAIEQAWQKLTTADDKQVVVELPLVETPPSVSLASLNNLGINERIGFGESKYAHSIANRIHNVAITTERISNTLVAPGDEFSFNKTLGDVSSATGYRSAYVIKNGKTELGDGGGVCQVSTTLFRAVLNAGLQVTRRLPHSYRVSYYELDNKPGLDATVYAGETDFRFINDTDQYVLVHGVTDSANTYMYIELYGTSDGRTTAITEHKTWDARPAPPSEYYPDPTLPSGKVVQIDWAAPGIRASVTNEIYNADGSLKRTDTYVSNYKPWAAKYLQGTGG